MHKFMDEDYRPHRLLNDKGDALSSWNEKSLISEIERMASTTNLARKCRDGETDW